MFSSRKILVLGLFALTARAGLAAPAADVDKPWLEAGAASGWTYSAALKKAYLDDARSRTMAELSKRHLVVPQDFLAWVDSDPVIQTSVYASRRDPLPVLLGLRSLEIDLGARTVRRDYPQLALAFAINASHRGWSSKPAMQNDSRKDRNNGALPDISPRPLLKLSVPGDPRTPVDTKDPTRALDLNDHIINFLEDHADIEVETFVKEMPPLVYDKNGIAIQPKGNRKPVEVRKVVKRKLTAADVIASAALQKEFNEYMRVHGQRASIDTGDKVVDWYSKAGVAGPRRGQIAAACKLFTDAYRAKGRLPEARDPAATPAESMAWLIRNDRYPFTQAQKEARHWPLFPLNAPWPVLMMLADDDQPLREREEIWAKFRDTGAVKTYGEYIGDIAQQFDMQSARRLTPFAYDYGSIEMMWKDGGVCGTMGSIGARTRRICGIPAATCGQPGHCAMVRMDFDPKTGLFGCKGEQYATGGDEATSVHYAWNYDETAGNRPMIYHQSIAWAVNQGLPAYLDTLVVGRIYEAMPAGERAAKGPALLEQGLSINPYAFALVDAAQQAATDPAAQCRLLDRLDALLDAAATKPGAPNTRLYRATFREHFAARLAALPLPSDKAVLADIAARLEKGGCGNAALLGRYWLALDGQAGLQARSRAAFAVYLRQPRRNKLAKPMSRNLEAWARDIRSEQARAAWAAELLKDFSGKELLKAKGRLVVDDCLPVLCKAAGVETPEKAELAKPHH